MQGLRKPSAHSADMQVTALMRAAARGDDDTVAGAIAEGIDLFAQDAKGRTALDWGRIGSSTSRKGGGKLGILLLEHAIQSDLALLRKEKLTALFEDEQRAVLARNAVWSTDMLSAISTQDPEAIATLLKRTRLPRSRFESACFALQLVKPKWPVFFLEVQNAAGLSPLALAAARGDSVTLKQLLTAGAVPSRSALQWAAVGGHELIITELITRGGHTIATAQVP